MSDTIIIAVNGLYSDQIVRIIPAKYVIFFHIRIYYSTDKEVYL